MYLNFVALFSKDVIILICGLLSSILVARHLGPGKYGSYIFILLIYAYFINFGSFRVSKSILPYLKNNRTHEKTIFSFSLLLNCIFAAVTSLVLVAVGSIFNLMADFSPWLYPLLAAMIFSEFFLIFATYALSYRGEFRRFAGISTLRPILGVVGFALIFFFAGDQKVILPYFIVQAIAAVTAAMIAAVNIRDRINLSFFKYKELDLRKYFKTSLLFYLTDFVNFFTTKGVTTVVASKLATSNLAFFNMLLNHFDLLRFPNAALGAMMYPVLSREVNDQKQRHYILRKLLFNVMIYPPIFIAVYFLYPKLVAIFYGPEYSVVGEYFPYVMLLGAPYLMVYPIIHYFSSNGAPQYEGFIKLLSLMVQIFSVSLFIYSESFTLFNALLSQMAGYLTFTVALILVYRLKRFSDA